MSLTKTQETGYLMSYTKTQWAGYLLAILGIVVLIALDNMVIFEDGSWAIGNFPYILKGCFPWGICNL